MSWDKKKIGEIICENKKSKYKVRDSSSDGLFPFFRSGEKINRHSEYICEGENIFIATGGKANFKYHFGKASYSTDCYSIKSNEKVLSKFLYYFLKLNEKKINDEMFIGAALKHLQKKEFKNIEIPQPSLPKQKQIVEKLDAAFADIDKAISATEKNIENAEALFQSSLIKIFKNPEFKYLELEKVCNISGGGTPSKKNKSFYEGKIPWATVRDMKNDFIYDTEFKITDDAIKKSSTNLIPGGNVVIATRVGLGKVSIISCDTAINQDLKGIIPKREGLLDINFLFFWFKSISKVIIDAGTGATVQGVKLPFVKSLRIPNIDISLQRQLSSNIKQISEQKELLVSIYNQKLNHLTGLKSSLLNQAFSGELTKDVA